MSLIAGRFLSGLVLVSTSSLLLAQTIPEVFSSKPHIEASIGVDHLSNNYANWSSQNVDLLLPMQEKGLIYLQAMHAERYNLQDTSIYGSYSHPFQLGVVTAELGHASAPHFLSEHLYGLTWAGYGPYGFNYLLGTKQTQYTESRTAANSIGLETYQGNWRLAYTATHSDLNRIKSGWVNKYQVQWLGDISQIGLIYSNGDEPTVLSPGNLVNTHIESIQLNGVYALSKAYALTGSIWHVQQGYFYQRNGIQLGIRVSY